jgi:drug/metabolite transporter (DMT)-like permease
MSSHPAAAAAASSQAHHSHRTASIALAIGVFGIGWSAILVRWSGVAGMVSAFYRLLFASMVLLPWYAVRARRRPRTPLAPDTRRGARIAAVVAGVVFAADLGFFNTSIMMTSAANATLLGVNAPIFVAIGAWLLYGDTPGARFWLGFALALAGMIYIVGADVVLHPTFGLGDSFALFGAMFYGAYLLYVQRARTAMDTLTFSTWCVCAGAATLLIVCVAARQPLWGFSLRSWASLVGLALATQVVGHLLVAYALGHLPVTVSSIVLLAQAPLTALFAWPLLGEPIRASQAIGGALVLAGILVVNRQRTRGNVLPSVAESATTPGT